MGERENELKEITHATNPDVLCFLEAKTNVDNLLAIKGFEDWAISVGFEFLHCYWSQSVGRGSHGNEGIVVFSKVKPKKLTYGMGEEEFDLQARVITLEFSDHIMVVTYNPQGGFTEKSLLFRQVGDIIRLLSGEGEKGRGRKEKENNLGRGF